MVHLLLSWSKFLSYTMLLFDLGLIGYLSMKAYQDADTLDRYVCFWERGLEEAC